MSRSKQPSCTRSPLWPRVAIFATIGLIAAGCSDSARFDSSPYASNNRQPPSDVTGSIGTRPAPTNQISSQPLPAPATVANNGYAAGAPGLGAYRPNPTTAEVTGSVPKPVAPPKPAGHWTGDGGSAVTVAAGQTLDTIAHKHGVPASAIMQVNHLASPAVHPGQLLVIPHYVSTAAVHAPAPVAQAEVHVVQPGETMMSIAHKHGLTLTALAHANNISEFGKISIGQRLVLPAGAHKVVAQAQPAAPKVAAPHTAPVVVGSVPPQNAHVVTPEPAQAQAKAPQENAVKTAEPVGAIPSFRWPVQGRVIAGFGSNINGAPNDGVNLAVPLGTPIKAADDGVVAYAGNELKGYGNLVLIRHANNFVSAYANASELMVKRGDTVKRGQVIAKAGQTGNVTSPQLHFEIRKGSTPIDPIKYLGGA